MHKAVILAAGRGTRMGGLTSDLPKPMLPLAGRPILEHLLDRLRSAGFSDFAIVTGYRREAIEEHFAGLGITFLRQEHTDGTARAALLAKEFVGADSFLLTFGDILVDGREYSAMADRMRQDPPVTAVAAARWVDDPWQGAAVYERDGRVTRIVEKPSPGSSTTNWNSAGVYCFRAGVFDEFARVPKSPRGEYELTGAVEVLVETGNVQLHAIQGVWRDIGRPEDWEAAQSEV